MSKRKHIPVNTLPSGTREGIVIGRATRQGSPNFKAVEESHRDNGHLFILQEKGSTHIEIDFQILRIDAPAVVYIHPSQVHRLIAFEQATLASWIITSENLQPEFIKLLEDLNPVNILTLAPDTLIILSQAATLCLDLVQRKQEKIYDSILKSSCNTLVALVLSQYLAQSKLPDGYSRFELNNKAFKSLLEQNFKSVKSPAEYAGSLNLSASYLNECVHETTGHSVSFHIRERVFLEAKRLLFHSSKSVKEIAAELGYDDFSYFTRLFTKVAGMTPIAFRNKNLV
ncbi:AraC family transcriptional regulator [Pedobacter sp. MC2016-24]|uniref:helix-turn-helix domain-containing protein n=1 Tax=Pedobacter sp. MC2016-24 TaxID=2780090 RepID=UPI001D16EDAD|nr:helix-turn-helix transcriptional regulator [Pedobacter sp. MC2016-24]